ncbi:hypothetical protein CCH79_00020141 [Gambusia affinis]|uniref:PKD domain-containing protein n=1 Tax=Gambusia affinis TaxID=33528 RepID=A0A315WEV9_GAMAF|nr:hypothetical protein CCH79_00020141 [Gambusia affinis]
MAAMGAMTSLKPKNIQIYFLLQDPVRMRRRNPRHAGRRDLVTMETLHAASTAPTVPTASTAPSSSSLLPTAHQNLNLPANGSSDGVPVPLPQNATVDPTEAFNDTTVAPPPAGERQQRRHMTCRWERGLCPPAGGQLQFSQIRRRFSVNSWNAARRKQEELTNAAPVSSERGARFLSVRERGARFLSDSERGARFLSDGERGARFQRTRRPFPERQRTPRAAHWSCSPPAVRELVVSAGESVEVTLPRNEVELNAYVVPTPQPGKVSPGGGASWRGAELPSMMLHVWFSAGSSYTFEWRLTTHPRNYNGEMEGKKGQTLKLSKVLVLNLVQLTVGLYEFEVTVMDGDGARGRGYVNVTVRPEPRVNKPPVAMVSPKYQEISLPTSSTVIDGSPATALTQTFLLLLFPCAESTDDDKVVTWHWEEVKGPLREEKVSANTPILTLTNLVPGNYTFSLTVTDSDGATDSTQATLSVNKATDYKPVANAGPNQVRNLFLLVLDCMARQQCQNLDYSPPSGEYFFVPRRLLLL